MQKIKQPRPYQVRQLTGQKFGMLLVLAEHGRDARGATWACRCECGREKVVASRHLVSGSTVSCGCHRARWGGASVTAEYNSWNGMMYRCSGLDGSRPKHYHDKGVKVCPEWYDFDTFLRDMGKRPGPGYSLDRIDVTGDYEPGNCRWATHIQQQRNRRNHTLITIDGVTKLQSEWCEQYGISRQCFRVRLGRGRSPKDALMMAKRGGRVKCLD